MDGDYDEEQKWGKIKSQVVNYIKKGGHQKKEIIHYKNNRI